ncbi:MAG: YtxH domain-containing protein [Beutenbergiaceae bacterium]
MKGKVAFIIGAGLGYVLGTRAGREQYDKLKAGAMSALQHPAVKDRVAQAESAISDTVREQGAQMTDRVANLVKDRFHGSSRAGADPTTDPEQAGPDSGAPGWDTPSR